MAYRRCEVCGAYLDPAEKCDCGGVAPAVPVPAPTRQRLHKLDPDRAWLAFDSK